MTWWTRYNYYQNNLLLGIIILWHATFTYHSVSYESFLGSYRGRLRSCPMKSKSVWLPLRDHWHRRGWKTRLSIVIWDCGRWKYRPCLLGQIESSQLKYKSALLKSLMWKIAPRHHIWNVRRTGILYLNTGLGGLKPLNTLNYQWIYIRNEKVSL